MSECWSLLLVRINAIVSAFKLSSRHLGIDFMDNQAHYAKTWHHPQNSQCKTASEVPSLGQSTCTQNSAKKVLRIDSEKDRQKTNMLITILCILLEAKWLTNIKHPRRHLFNHSLMVTAVHWSMARRLARVDSILVAMWSKLSCSVQPFLLKVRCFHYAWNKHTQHTNCIKAKFLPKSSIHDEKFINYNIKQIPVFSILQHVK